MAEATSDESFLSSDEPLSHKDLPTLLDLLFDVAHKWEEIAVFLKLRQGQIAVIKAKESGDGHNKLMEVIRLWLARTNPHPTVMALVEVLRKPFFGEEKVALNIEKHSYPSIPPGCLQKSMSTSEAQIVALRTESFGRSESSPASVSISKPKAVQHASTQVSIPESDPLSKPSDHQNPDAILESSTEVFESLQIEHKSSYKYLDLAKMTELEQRTLKGHLTNEYKRITSLYSKLNQRLIQSLKDRSVTLKQLSQVLMNLSAFRVQKHNVEPLLADNMDNIRESEDIGDAFYLLRSYGSFFDYHVIKHIISSDLCTDTDRKELEKYENELNIYCQRSVFECPHIDNLNPKFQKFVMKVDDVVLKSSEIKAIDAFRVELAEACGLEPHTLQLCSVEMGCLELIFQVPHSVVDYLFPLTGEQTLTLKRLGVLRLICGDYSLDYGLVDTPQPRPTKVSFCAWYKVLGKCNYGDECRYKHDVTPVPIPVVGDVPEFATLESVKQLTPCGYTADGKAYVIIISPSPKNEMKIAAEDRATLEFAQAEVGKLLQSKIPALQCTRLKYSYIQPDGVAFPFLYVFKKQESTNNYELHNIKPKVQVKERTVESFDHMTRQHVTPAYSRLYRHKKNVYPVQLRRDYREDIHEQLRHGLRWMHENGHTPQIEGRLGKFTWRECLDDECFDVEKLMSLTKEEGKLKYYTFITEFEDKDVTTIKKICGRQIGFEETYTLNLKDSGGSDETYRVQVKFDTTGKQSIVYIRKTTTGSAQVQVLLDILFLHRKYDVRVSLCSVENVVNPSVQHFISSAIKMLEPGIIEYDPTASEEKWCLTYIRHHESQTFRLKDLYTLDISTVGQYTVDVDDIKHRQIVPKDFNRRCEVELHCDSWAKLDTISPPWTPETVMNDFEEGGFLQILEEINETLQDF